MKRHTKKRRGHKKTKLELRSRLIWLYLRQFYMLYKYYILITVLFFIFYGIFFIPVGRQTGEEGTDLPVLRIESIDVCEGFDMTSHEAVGCNHIFRNGTESVVIFYSVSFNETPVQRLSVRWYRGEDLLQEGLNDFTQDGKPVEPGEYLLAMQSDFALEVGNYRVTLYEGPGFLGYIGFAVVP